MSEPDKRSALHIPSLDGIRAASFLLVFCGHAVPVEYSRMIPPGFGVTVFFVLSGYLITTLLRLEYEKSGTINFRNFYLRRVLRIFPPFYIVLIVSVLLVKLHLLGGGTELGPLTALSLHVANYWYIHMGNTGLPDGTSVYWSLAVEEHFYLVFPIFYFWIRRSFADRKSQLFAILAACALVLAWRTIHLCFINPDADARATDLRVDSILFGCAMATYGNPALDKTRFSEATWKYGAVLLAVLALGLTFTVRSFVFHGAIKQTVQSMALVLLFIVAVRYPTWWPVRIFNTKAATFIGVLSYTLYLAHRTIIDVLEQLTHANWAVLALLALPTSIAFAYAMFRLVEEPCARLRKRLSASAPAAPPRAVQEAA